MTRTIASSPHELKGHLHYAADGLSPYWQQGKAIQALDGGGQLELELDGEEWGISIGHSRTGIAPRRTDAIDADRLLKYQFNCYGNGRRKVSLTFEPKFEGMRHYESGDRVSSPYDNDNQPNEAVEVHYQASNVEPVDLEALIPWLVKSVMDELKLDWTADYYVEPSDLSSVYEYERYVRANRELATKVVRQGGPIERLNHLYGSMEGVKAEFKIDNREITGYNHRAQLHRSAAERLLPAHYLGKQIKHYHPKNVRKDADDDPLYHPKIGVLYRKSLHGSAHPWSEIRGVGAELEETIVNILEWADVPIQPGGTFVSDDHFTATRETNRDVDVYDDPTPAMERRQDSVLLHTLTELKERDRDLLREVVTDGGEHQHPTDLAEGMDCSVSTVYRALNELDGLLENENASVSFISEKMRQDVHDIFERVQSAVEGGRVAIERLLGADAGAVKQRSESLQRWLNKYGVQLLEGEGNDRLRLKFEAVLSRQRLEDVPRIVDVLEEGRRAWKDAGRELQEFKRALIEAETPGIENPIQSKVRREEEIVGW